MKIANHQIVMREFPDEVTLALNISGCPNHCVGCHSTYLKDDIGEDATRMYVINLIKQNPGITCVGFMGGDGREEILKDLAFTIKANYPSLKIGWYSGRDAIDSKMLAYFDYVKFGRYDANYGPLNHKGTNQCMLKCTHDGEFINTTAMLNNTKVEDITYRFWESSAM